MSEENSIELAYQLKSIMAKAEGFNEELKGRMEKGEKLSENIKGDVDELLKKMTELSSNFAKVSEENRELSSRIDDVEQKQVRGSIKTDEEENLLRKFCEGEDLRLFAKNYSLNSSISIDFQKSIINSSLTGTGAAGALVTPYYAPDVTTLPTAPLTIRDLLNVSSTDSNIVEFVRQTGFTNNAAPFAENSAMAQSTLKFDPQRATVEDIGHFAKTSARLLNDAPALENEIKTQLLFGLRQAEEDQLLNGTGSDNQLHGILSQATAFSDPVSKESYSIIDLLRLAMLQATLAHIPPSGYVLHPIGWAKIELEKDSIGRNIIGDPKRKGFPSLWGLPVVESYSIPVDKFLVGSFKVGATLYDREGATIAIATENRDDFEKKLITISATERLALAVRRPEAFVYGDLVAKTK